MGRLRPRPVPGGQFQPARQPVPDGLRRFTQGRALPGVGPEFGLWPGTGPQRLFQPLALVWAAAPAPDSGQLRLQHVVAGLRGKRVVFYPVKRLPHLRRSAGKQQHVAQRAGQLPHHLAVSQRHQRVVRPRNRKQRGKLPRRPLGVLGHGVEHAQGGAPRFVAKLLGHVVHLGHQVGVPGQLPQLGPGGVFLCVSGQGWDGTGLLARWGLCGLCL